jgi:ubiquinone/menaquinone biosynthesis C-methylase UbiE
MSDADPAERTRTVRDLFDRKAVRWTRAYQAGGALATRAQLFLTEILALRPPPGRVLDFGCGTGHIAKAVADGGYTAHGLDMSSAMLAEGRRLFGDVVDWTLLSPAWSSLPFADAFFDVVLASSVLEYVQDPTLVLAELARVSRSGGLLVVTVPNMRHPKRWLENLIARGLGRSRVASALADRLPRLDMYARFLRTSRTRFSAEEWTSRFRAAGFEVERVGAATSPTLELFSLVRRGP